MTHSEKIILADAVETAISTQRKLDRAYTDLIVMSITNLVLMFAVFYLIIYG